MNPALALAGRVAISGTLIAAAFWLTSDKLDWRQIATLDPVTLAVCVALSLFVVWVLAWRWQQVVASMPMGRSALPSIWSFMGQTWICLAVNQVVPSIVGGDATRAVLLSRHGIPLAGAASSVFVDRAFGLLGLALLTGATAFMLAPVGALPVTAVSISVVAVLALLGFTGKVALPRRFRALLPSDLNWHKGVLLALAAVIGHLANIAIFLLTASALGVELPVFPAIAVMCSVLLLSMFPVSVAGWGVRELALVQAFGHMGLSADKVILSSIVYGLVMFITQASGFVLFARRNRP